MTRYRLAPMSPLIRGLTLALFGIPLAFLALPFAASAPPPLAGVGLAVLALFAAIWIWWRPTCFELSSEALRIVFPGRSRLVPLGDVSGCRLLTGEAFKQEFGRAMRVGAGGLWGGFGWLWTQKGGFVDFYVSRTDGFVLVERRGARHLLITPEQPEALAEQLRATIADRREIPETSRSGR